jgi:hypothetical protein
LNVAAGDFRALRERASPPDAVGFARADLPPRQRSPMFSEMALARRLFRVLIALALAWVRSRPLRAGGMAESMNNGTAAAMDAGMTHAPESCPGCWGLCERKILVIMLMDCTIEAVTACTDTDTPDEGGFDEVWLADHTQVEAFRGVDLFAIVHPDLKGAFDVASRDRKPYG